MKRVRVTLLPFINAFVKSSSALWLRCSALFDSFMNRVHNFAVDLGEETGFLALSLMANRRLHPFERYLWFILVIVGIFGTIMLSESQVNRYFTSPTVISVERDYRGWSGTLPAVTLCYYDRIDTIRANDYIQEHFNVSVTDADYSYMIDFLNAVLNASASNYSDLAGFSEDARFDDIDLFHLLRSIDRPFEQTLTTFDVNFDLHILPVMTERGACYVINAPMSEIMGGSSDEQELKAPLTCQFGKQQCYIKMDLYESTGVVDIHSPFEVSTDANAIALEMSDEIIASYKVLETVASPKLRELSVKQRKCVFYDEETSQLKVYSKSLCLVRCRAVMALEMCNCVPFFYQFMEGPSCSPAGFECLEDFKWPIWALHICRCPSTCTEIEYTVQTVKKSSWGLKPNQEAGNKADIVVSSFRWDLIPPKVRMRRDVVFGFDDLLVSFGGVMALCLGLSILSVTQTGFVFAYHFIQFIVDSCIFLHENVRQFYDYYRRRRLEAQRGVRCLKPGADERPLKLSPDNLSQLPASVNH